MSLCRSCQLEAEPIPKNPTGVLYGETCDRCGYIGGKMNKRIDEIEEEIFEHQKSINNLISERNEIRNNCSHENTTLFPKLFGEQLYCKDCNKLLGKKCKNRIKSICSYGKNPDYHRKCRHCDRIWEDDCQ